MTHSLAFIRTLRAASAAPASYYYTAGGWDELTRD